MSCYKWQFEKIVNRVKKELENNSKRRDWWNLQELKSIPTLKEKKIPFGEEAEVKNWGSKGAYLWSGEWARDKRGRQTQRKLEELSTKIKRYEQDEEESIKSSIFRKTLRFGSIQF